MSFVAEAFGLSVNAMLDGVFNEIFQRAEKLISLSQFMEWYWLLVAGTILFHFGAYHQRLLKAHYYTLYYIDW